jgi:molybdopterin synthase sulfur carrier subunit
VAWLTRQGEGYAYAFENPNVSCAARSTSAKCVVRSAIDKRNVSCGVVRSAIDKRQVRSDARIAGASEIAFFPPMTGG